MARTIMAVYESCYTAKQAVQELVEKGIERDSIDTIARSTQSKNNGESEAPVSKKVQSEILASGAKVGMQVGAGIGGAAGITGGLLALLGVLPVPGITVLAGFTAVAAAVTLLGTAAGGLLGNILGLAVPEQEARQYAKNIRQGDVVVTILADWDTVDPVIEILHKYNPLEVREKAPILPKSGRSGFNPVQY